MPRAVIIRTATFFCILAAYSTTSLATARYNSATRAAAAAGAFRSAPFVVPDVLHPPTPDGIQSRDDFEDPEQRPGLFQGDIAIDPVSHQLWKVGLRWDVFPERLWPNGTVPYAISDLYEPGERVTIRLAMRSIEALTCVRFVPWSGSAVRQPDYLLVWPVQFPSGCWSYVGRTGGQQIVSLQPPSGERRRPHCLGNEGRAIHELLHALGIFHEQSRADRDRYVQVHWENIGERFRGNFEKQSRVNTTYAFEYDYGSIMHYGRGFFAKDRRKPTLTAKQLGGVDAEQLGQRRGLSTTDCLKVNELYGCLGRSAASKRRYFERCRVLGV